MRILLIICFALLLAYSYSNGQTITTYAGFGCAGPTSGDDIPATAACIGLPGGGSFDAVGNYYFAEDFGGSRVEKVGIDGIIHNVAGNGGHIFSGDNGPATDASIVWAYAIVDPAGNIYIPDRDNYRVRKVDVSTGIIHTIAGNGSRGHAGDGGPATSASIFPYSVCVDLLGNVYVVDSTTWIRKISTAGVITTIAGNGYQGYTSDNVQATSAGLYNCGVALCIDNIGNILIGSAEGRIRKIDITTGVITTIAGNGTPAPYLGDGLPATDAQFIPYAIAVDRWNNLFVADYGVGNSRVLKIDTSGIVHTIAGTGTDGYSGDGGPGTAAQICNPEGVAIDVCGNIYIADDCYRRIRKVTFNPSCTPTDSVSLKTTTVNINKQVSVYPNPVYDEVNVNAANKITGITITNLLGQQMLAIQYNSIAVRVDMREMPAGVYFMKVTDEDGVQTVERVVKE